MPGRRPSFRERALRNAQLFEIRRIGGVLQARMRPVGFDGGPFAVQSAPPPNVERSILGSYGPGGVGAPPVVPVSNPCKGPYCRRGGTYGKTGMYNIGGKDMCAECAVKTLGIEGLSSKTQTRILQNYLKK